MKDPTKEYGRIKKRPEFQYNPLDFEPDVAIGLTLPLTNDAQAAVKYNVVDTAAGIGTSDLTSDQGLHDKGTVVNGDFAVSYTTIEQTKSNMRNLVLTNKGERVMHPNFGCDIYKLLFNNITPSIINQMKSQIQKQVNIWLDYVNLLDVDIRQVSPDVNKVNINIWFALYNDSINKEMITINNIGAL
jgi:phage baseplate assembly protein W